LDIPIKLTTENKLDKNPTKFVKFVGKKLMIAFNFFTGKVMQ